MRIFLLTKEFPPYNCDGGISIYMGSLTKELRHQGHTVTIVTAIHKKEKHPLADGIVPVSMPYWKYPLFRYLPFLYDILFAWKAWLVLRKIDADIIETHEWGFPSLFIEVFRISIPVVVRVHGLYRHILLGNKGAFGLNLWIYDHLELYCMNMADSLVFPSVYMQKMVLSDYHITNEKQGIYPLGIDTSVFYPQPIKKNVDFTFIFTGRLVERKNVLMLLKVFRTILQKRIDIKLILVGEMDPYDAPVYLDYITKHNLQTKIILKGYITHAMLAEELSGADVFITLSTYETFGLNLYEAMASGLPVIGYEDIVPACIEEEKLGLVLSRELSVENISDEVISYIADRNLLARQGKEAALYIKTYNTLEKIVKKEIKLYEAVLSV